MKKSVPWSFRFTGEAPHVKTELWSPDSFSRISHSFSEGTSMDGDHFAFPSVGSGELKVF